MVKKNFKVSKAFNISVTEKFPPSSKVSVLWFSLCLRGAAASVDQPDVPIGFNLLDSTFYRLTWEALVGFTPIASARTGAIPKALKALIGFLMSRLKGLKALFGFFVSIASTSVVYTAMKALNGFFTFCT